MNKIVFLFLLCVFIDGLMKHLPLFDDFIDGVKDALQLCRTLFTTFMALMVFIQLLQSSGTIDLLSHLFSPLSFDYAICHSFGITKVISIDNNFHIQKVQNIILHPPHLLVIVYHML